VVDAIRGHRAVLSAAGGRDLKKASVLAQAIPSFSKPWIQEYVTRIIVLGAAGVRPDYGKYQNALTTMAFWVAKKTMLRPPFCGPDCAGAPACGQRRRLHHSAGAPATRWTLHWHLSRPARRAPARRLADQPGPTSPTLCCSSLPIRASIARAHTSAPEKFDPGGFRAFFYYFGVSEENGTQRGHSAENRGPRHAVFA